MTGPSVRRAAGLVTLQGEILSKIWPWSGRFLITFFSLLNYVVDSAGNLIVKNKCHIPHFIRTVFERTKASLADCNITICQIKIQ